MPGYAGPMATTPLDSTDLAGLPDVRGLLLDDASPEDASALDKALERILAAAGGCNFNSFGSSI
jgi:hypothetical protein